MRKGLAQRTLLHWGILGASLAHASNTPDRQSDAGAECVSLLVTTTYGGDALLNAVLEGLASTHPNTLGHAIALLPELNVMSMNPDHRRRTVELLVPALRRLAADESLSDEFLAPVWAALNDFGDF